MVLEGFSYHFSFVFKYNNTTYQQVGVLTSDEYDKDPIVLPLFSRKLNNNNDRYNYYTATDNNNMMSIILDFILTLDG
jgi:outer membrane receptor for Fe3+-dicitrate